MMKCINGGSSKQIPTAITFSYKGGSRSKASGPRQTHSAGEPLRAPTSHRCSQKSQLCYSPMPAEGF